MASGNYYDGTRDIETVWILNMTDGVLTHEANESWFLSGHSTATTILNADIDNDGISEITTIGFKNDGGDITIFEYNGSFLKDKEVIWNETTSVRDGDFFDAAKVYDLNSDGTKELISGGRYALTPPTSTFVRIYSITGVNSTLGSEENNAPPLWSNNQTNLSTKSGTIINHSISWTDETALRGYIFEFDNGTGTFTNDSFVTMIGTQNVSDVFKFINETIGSTIRWRIYANDSIGNINVTDIFSYNTAWAIDAPNVAFEFDQGSFNSLVKINDTHYLNAYGSGGGGSAVVLEVNLSGDSNVTNVSVPFEFDTNSDQYNSLVKINDTHYLNTYAGVDSDGFAVVLEVNLSGDFSVTNVSIPFEFDAIQGTYNSLVKINNTHYLNTYTGEDLDGYAVVLEVNMSGDFSVTNVSIPFEFDVANSNSHSLVKINNTHYLNTYAGESLDGLAVVLEVNLSGNFNVTNVSVPFVFETVQAIYNSMVKINDTHYLNTYSGSGNDGFAVVLEVNLSGDFSVTKPSSLEFDTTQAFFNSLVKINDTYYLNTFAGTDNDGFAVVLEINFTDFTLTKLSSFEFDTSQGSSNSLVKINNTHYLNAYQGTGDNALLAIVLTVDVLKGTDTIFPLWSNNQTNLSTKSGTVINHSVSWTDDNDLSGYVFEFDNGTGTFVNDSFATMTGTSDNSDVFKFINETIGSTIRWRIYANDSTGNINVTDIFSYNTAWVIDAPNAAFEFHNNANYNSLVKINKTHYLNTYSVSAIGYAVVLEVNFSDSSVTNVSTPFKFDTINVAWNSLVKINDTHYLNTYIGDDGDGFVVVLEVNLSGDFSVTDVSTPFEFDATQGRYNSLVKINNTHYLNTYAGTDDDGFAIVLEVNLSGDFSVTNVSVPFEFDTLRGIFNSLVKINDTHYLNTYYGESSDGFAVVLEVDLSDFSVTNVSVPFEFDTNNGEYNSLVKINDTHYLNTYSGFGKDGFAIVLEVNLSGDFSVTNFSSFEFETNFNSHNSLVKINDTYYLNVYSNADQDGIAGVLEVNLTDFNVTNVFSFNFDTSNSGSNSLVKINDTHYLKYIGKYLSNLNYLNYHSNKLSNGLLIRQ